MREKKPTTSAESTSINWEEATRALNVAKQARREKARAYREYARVVANAPAAPDGQPVSDDQPVHKTQNAFVSRHNRALKHTKIGGLAVAAIVGATLALVGGKTSTGVETVPLAQAPQKQVEAPDHTLFAKKEQTPSEKSKPKQERLESKRTPKPSVRRYANPLPVQRTAPTGNSVGAPSYQRPTAGAPVVTAENSNSTGRPTVTAESPERQSEQQLPQNNSDNTSGGANFEDGSREGYTGGATSGEQPSSVQHTNPAGGAVATERPATQTGSGGVAAR